MVDAGRGTMAGHQNSQQDPVAAGPRHGRVSLMAVRTQGFVGFAGHRVLDGFATGRSSEIGDDAAGQY